MFQWYWFGYFGDGQDFVLFGCFDYVCVYLFGIDLGGLGEVGQDWLQCCCVYFDGFLYYVIELGVFEWGEDIGEVGKFVLRLGLLQDDEVVGLFVVGDGGLLFFVLVVEGQDFGFGGQLQDIVEIIVLVVVEWDFVVLGEGGVDEQVGVVEIVGRY